MKNLQEVLSEGNSTTNQQIKGRFIDQHVNANVNSLVEYVLSKSFEDSDAPFSYDDIENMYILPEYSGKVICFEGGTDEDRDECINDAIKELEELEDELEELSNLDDASYLALVALNEKIDLFNELTELRDLESEPQDIMEFWLVSSFLCEKLQALGHPVLSDENIWGRCTSGQAILLDYAITQICADIGILDGQESSWA